MFDDLDMPKKKGGFEIGCALDDYSISELSEIIVELEAEIKRLQSSIESKKASSAAADMFFKR